MIFDSALKRKPHLEVWHKWFAWYPVILTPTETAWLHVIERQGQPNEIKDGVPTSYFFHYRKVA